jgi:transcriptional regulator with XRE-family HTH domain
VRQDFVQKFGERVQTLRKRKGISQEKFADLVGLDRTYISGIERGKRNPSLFALKNIADALDTTLEKLFRSL